MTVTNPYIVGGTVVFTDSGTATLTFYGVQSETINKTSGFIDLPMPVSDSNSKIMMDLMGTTRTIQIDGVATSSQVTNLYNYVNDLVGLRNSPTAARNTLIFGEQGSNGGQAGWKYYPESLNRGRVTDIYITVYVTDVSVTSEAGNPNSIKYSVTMMECDATSSA